MASFAFARHNKWSTQAAWTKKSVKTMASFASTEAAWTNKAESINNQIVEEVNNSSDESSNHETAADTTDEIDTIEEYECHLCNSVHPSQASREECCDHRDCSFLECHSHPAFFKLT